MIKDKKQDTLTIYKANYGLCKIAQYNILCWKDLR